MLCLRKEIKLVLDAHLVGVSEVYGLDAFNNLVDILFNGTFGAQVTLVIELWVADVCNILHKILSDTESQCLNVAVIAQLLHHLTARFDSCVVIASRFQGVLPIFCSF